MNTLNKILTCVFILFTFLFYKESWRHADYERELQSKIASLESDKADLTSKLVMYQQQGYVLEGENVINMNYFRYASADAEEVTTEQLLNYLND